MTETGEPEASEEHPIDPETVARLLDVGLYAPIGFAVEFRRLLPEMIKVGKRQVGFSRSLGAAALKTLMNAAAEAAATQHAEAGDTSDAPAARRSQAESKTAPSKSAARRGSRVKASGAPFAGYDDMTARDLVQRIRTTAPGGLEVIERYERAGKGRKTVLDAVAAARRRA